jgi:hypothetical protein
MSEMPHCAAGQQRCKMLRAGYFGWLRIREFNRKLIISRARITESIAQDSGLIKVKAAAVPARRTALEMLGKVSGCTIGVDKCIQ